MLPLKNKAIIVFQCKATCSHKLRQTGIITNKSLIFFYLIQLFVNAQKHFKIVTVTKKAS